jgi:hypothetical protein
VETSDLYISGARISVYEKREDKMAAMGDSGFRLNFDLGKENKIYHHS